MISIIIPCYNCENTLAEAVASCFTQDIPDFEIIMVDDGSSDGTRSLMESLAEKHHEIRLEFHARNRGGGAARNTGIRAAKGDLIYCLDSDNIFAPGTLKRAADFISADSLDGAAFYERRFFRGIDAKAYSSKCNKTLGRSVRLEDLFNGNDILLDNFLYTKASYLKTAGYPEHHGFDTQTFEIAYLAAGNSVAICPDTAFYHRQAQKGRKSYFEREYEKGLFSINTFLALEPALRLLDDSVIDLCIRFDVLNDNRFGTGRNLLDALREHVTAGRPLLFGGKRSPRTEAFIETAEAIGKEEYGRAREAAKRCEAAYGSRTPLLSVTMLRIQVAMEGGESRKREEETGRRLSEMGLLRRRKMRWTSPLISSMYSLAKAPFRGKTMNSIKNFAGKVRRHAFSLILSPLTRSDSRRWFAEAYGRARKLFAEREPKYRYSAYLVPEWQSNTEAMSKYFAERFSFSFLRNPIIKRTMFLSTPAAWKKIQKAEIAKVFGSAEAKRLLREHSCGKPLIDDAESVSSGNTIHHLSHIAKFSEEARIGLKSLKMVAELGGGYGNLARIMREINPSMTYSIIDIPVFIFIQMTYLQTIFGEDAVRLVDDGSKVVPGKINLIPLDERTAAELPGMLGGTDLFVSTWALSESNAKTQDMVRDCGYFGAKHLLLAYQRASGSFSFAENIRDLGADYEEIFSGETDYLKDNFYLFARKK